VKELASEFNHALIIPTLSPVNLHGDNIEHLLLGTIAKESEFKYLRQQGFSLESDNGAFGLLQIERQSNYIAYKYSLEKHPKIHSYLLKLGGKNSVKFNLMFNFPYQILIARIIYLSIKHPLPDCNDLAGMAEYWLNYYNRNEENIRNKDESVNKFIAAYDAYVL